MIASPSLRVIKRDKSRTAFDTNRITRAVSLAMFATRNGPENPYRDDPDNFYGLNEGDFQMAAEIANSVRDGIVERFGSFAELNVEQIQNLVQVALGKANLFDVLMGYMKYRVAHEMVRPVEHGDNGLQEWIGISRYARFREELGRREVWTEAIGRTEDMHLRRYSPVASVRPSDHIDALVQGGIISPETVGLLGSFGTIEEEIRASFGMVKQKRVLPSMRSVQFGGAAIEAHEARVYNCTASPVNRIEFFKEYFYLLLCGAGCGFSVQKDHIKDLPALAPRPDEYALQVSHHIVEDSIEGWALALDHLIKSYVRGYKVEFSYHLIRDRGRMLKTSGGVAPGHLPLKTALDKAEKVLAGAAGRNLRPIEVYDVCMHVAKAVISGGVRRSATICLFSPDDQEMMAAKTNNWHETHPDRAMSNNSAVIVRGKVSRETFDRLFEAQKQCGEPGFYFVSDEGQDVLPNPCVEIALNPKLVVTQREIAKLKEYGYIGPLTEGQTLWGWQMCNLSTTAGSAASTPEEFYRQCRAAATIGTLQAGYTNIPFLGPVTRVINEREALIGVSICGVLDNPGVLLEPEVLKNGAEIVKATNALVAASIGINRAARTTCVKPEGTSSLVLNSGSGIHPHHARRYFRRVQVNRADKLFQEFKKTNPHMVEGSVWNPQSDDVITFPVEAPAAALLKDDVTALRLLQYVKLVQTHWVMNGRSHTAYTNAHHNVSNTINVADDEWVDVATYIWDNQEIFTGVAMLKATGDKEYRQAPRETLQTEDDVRRWNGLRYMQVDYTKVTGEDYTAGSEFRGAAVACAGGACTV